VAQLGARLNGIQKVRGSNPLRSTRDGRLILSLPSVLFQSECHRNVTEMSRMVEVFSMELSNSAEDRARTRCDGAGEAPCLDLQGHRYTAPREVRHRPRVGRAHRRGAMLAERAGG